ncbi:2-keto-3-deoxy-L-rhamnonate aldolase [Variovorax sp. SRS16]|uniref:HpcH/HpaI aldolase family protein n=1 Tax=Variovorax sp. SRS16 TaxID=282217 RepID=UPI00131776E1|nr:aldolase/citrate lyase family protein [Variovorax sp. SRS16]VTU13999.1 2-keto-3-deoxy-L-rhamnonate aldolase [Variovorax sp. SRS16]
MNARVKAKLARGETATMVLVNYPSPALVEKVGALGFDIAFIDTEKGSATTERIEEMCRAARAAGIAALVRPWSSDANLISRYLDLGADAVMVAAVDTPEAARALVEAVRYARFADHDQKLVVAMIESPQAIERLPQLLAVEGIDVWFIGPNDLAHRMGHPGNAAHPDVRAAVLSTLRAISDAGAIAGTLVTPQTVGALVDAGARLLMTRVSDLLAIGAETFHRANERRP